MNSKIHECKNAKIHEFKNSKIQEFTNSKIHEFKDSKIQEFKNSDNFVSYIRIVLKSVANHPDKIVSHVITDARTRNSIVRSGSIRAENAIELLLTITTTAQVPVGMCRNMNCESVMESQV